MFKDELDGMVKTELSAPREKTYSFKYYDDEGKKIKEKKSQRAQRNV